MKRLVLAFAMAASAIAQAAPALPDNNFIYVIGSGQVGVPPDQARIEVTLKASGPDHAKAFAQLQVDSRAVIAAAVSLGVGDKAIDAHKISKSYRYESNSYSSGSRPTLMELQQTVQFELNDLDKTVELADRVMKMQSVTGVDTSFSVADVRAGEAAATAKAAMDAQQRAQEVAKLFGRKLGKATALSMESDGAMRDHFGGSGRAGGGSTLEAVSVMGNRQRANYRMPNTIDFSARLYIVYALE